MICPFCKTTCLTISKREFKCKKRTHRFWYLKRKHSYWHIVHIPSNLLLDPWGISDNNSESDDYLMKFEKKTRMQSAMKVFQKVIKLAAFT